MPDQSLKRYYRNWVEVNGSYNKIESVTCKEQEVFCTTGIRGKKCMRFLGLTKEECPLPILVVEIKGLGLGQDLNPNSNVLGYVSLSQRKENNASGTADNDNNVSTSSKVRQRMLQKVIIPFAKKLRQGDPYYNNISTNDTICNSMQSAL